VGKYKFDPFKNDVDLQDEIKAEREHDGNTLLPIAEQSYEQLPEN